MSKAKIAALGTLYWVVQLTWGALMTLIGFLAFSFAVLFLKATPHKNGFGFIAEVGGNWGGVSFGPFALCGRYFGTSYWEEISAHEFGHSLWKQHFCMGPFFVFFVAIPSACRYWYQRIKQEKLGERLPDGWYYRFWAEEDASEQGAKWKALIESTSR